MRAFKNTLPWLLILIMCASCGRSEKGFHQAHSLSEAKTLAAQKGTFMVIDFWRHG